MTYIAVELFSFAIWLLVVSSLLRHNSPAATGQLMMRLLSLPLALMVAA